MKCPRCGNDETFVLKTTMPDTKPVESIKQRRRRCNKCELPFMTFEIQESDFDRLCSLFKLDGLIRSPLKTRTPPKESDKSS